MWNDRDIYTNGFESQKMFLCVNWEGANNTAESWSSDPNHIHYYHKMLFFFFVLGGVVTRMVKDHEHKVLKSYVLDSYVMINDTSG